MSPVCNNRRSVARSCSLPRCSSLCGRSIARVRAPAPVMRCDFGHTHTHRHAQTRRYIARAYTFAVPLPHPNTHRSTVSSPLKVCVRSGVRLWVCVCVRLAVWQSDRGRVRDPSGHAHVHTHTGRGSRFGCVFVMVLVRIRYVLGVHTTVA